MKKATTNKFFLYLFIFSFFFFHFGQTKHLYAEKFDDLSVLIGNQDAVLIADPQGDIVFSKNSDVQLVPASTLKILTSLLALHYLGPEYRFVTEFYMDPDSNLKIKGYGDPLLISEVLAEIVNNLATRIDTTATKINDLILDDSYFKAPIVIPGVTSSHNPYDAPNGALCANFNTVAFRRSFNGTYVSAEPQTPLLPFALSRINKTSTGEGRIILSTKNNDIPLYTGHLLFYFMKKQGFELSGGIRMGKFHKENDKLILSYMSRFTLKQIVAKLLEHSNNFVSNQLLIVAGAKIFGPPGTLEKGVRAALTYAKNILEIDDIHMVEGSGISKKNRISAKSLFKTLQVFLPYHSLMHKTGKMSYKTGTLHGVNTRAGYVENKKGELYYFVVLINTPGKSPKRMMDIILKAID